MQGVPSQGSSLPDVPVTPVAADTPVRGKGVRGVLPYPLKYLGRARQVIIVTSRSWTGTRARLEAYEDGAHGWVRVLGPVDARVGRTGMLSQQRRLARTGTTPAGTFALSLAFGLHPDPGTRMPYVHITSEDHWWVADPMSVHYNTLRLGEEGGFRRTEAGARGSKRIAAHPEHFGYTVVIDFNRPYPNRKLGAGVFLCVSSGLSTDGSVAVEKEALVQLLGWLDPELDPVITLAPESVVAQY